MSLTKAYTYIQDPMTTKIQNVSLVLTHDRYLTRLTATMSNVEQIESYLLVSLNQTSGADGALCPVCIV